MLWGVKVQDGEAPKGALGEQWADCGVPATCCLSVGTNQFLLPITGQAISQEDAALAKSWVCLCHW